MLTEGRRRSTGCIARAPRRLARLGICLLLLALVLPAAAHAEPASAPDYAAPARWRPPWDCDAGYRVTWEPADHWAHGKASGIAYDLALPEGAPIYAPADGNARFLLDTRPYETNYGHYIELETPDGWVIRMAHLRDLHLGEREVRTGELLGHAGHSGVMQTHLHLELLLRAGTRLERPDPQQLTMLFGLPITDFVEGAVIVNVACPPKLTLATPVRLARDVIELGEDVSAVVRLRNESATPCAVDTLQLILSGPENESLVAELTDAGTVAGRATLDVTVPISLNAAGLWTVRGVVCVTPRGTFRLDAHRGLIVRPAALRLMELDAPYSVDVGGRIRLTVAVVNLGPTDRTVADLVVEGQQPDGTPWCARAGEALTLAAGATTRVSLTCASVPQRTGTWQLRRFGVVYGGRTLYITPLHSSLAVCGPELRIDRMAAYRYDQRLIVHLWLSNVGTLSASPDAVELWGWLGESDAPVSLSVATPAPLAPQGSALVQLSTTLEAAGDVQFVEGGYWIDGVYYRMGLPN